MIPRIPSSYSVSSYSVYLVCNFALGSIYYFHANNSCKKCHMSITRHEKYGRI